MLFDLKATFDGSGSGRELLDEVLQTPILVLDDLGSERLSDWAKDILSYIIIHRYNTLKPIIITSNLDLRDGREIGASLEERMGKAIASRIAETCELIYVKGKDNRVKTHLKKIG